MLKVEFTPCVELLGLKETLQFPPPDDVVVTPPDDVVVVHPPDDVVVVHPPDDVVVVHPPDDVVVVHPPDDVVVVPPPPPPFTQSPQYLFSNWSFLESWPSQVPQPPVLL